MAPPLSVAHREEEDSGIGGGGGKDNGESRDGGVGGGPAVGGIGERWVAPHGEGRHRRATGGAARGGEEGSFIQKFYCKIIKVVIIWIAISSFGNPDYLMRDNLDYQSKKHTKRGNLMGLL